jgi:hypothetical protein
MLWTVAVKSYDKWVQFPSLFFSKEQAEECKKEVESLLSVPENLRVQKADMKTHTSPDHCLLCGGEPIFLALWVASPKIAKRIGQPEGKNRMIFYALCHSCYKLPLKEPMADMKLIKQLQVN